MEIRFVQMTNVREGPSITSRATSRMLPGAVAQTTGNSGYADGYEWHELYKSGWVARALKDGTELFKFVDASKFNRSVEFTLSWEGGYVNNPADPGGETKYGISKRSYPKLDIKGLTIAQAKHIYFTDFWTPIGCEALNYPECLAFFDIGVISGKARAQNLMTAYAGNAYEALIDQYRFYVGLANFDAFGRGWVRRNTDLLERVVRG